MSRKRNRNVTGKWPSQPQLLKHVHDEENFFGSEIVSNFPSPEYDSFENFKANDFIRQVYFDGSSSSSLSGYEDFETEATHKVENELIQMNKVLQKEVPILDHYDKEEYEQWMHMFPDVSLWDRKNNGSTESVLLNDNNDRIKPRRNNFGFVSRNKNDLGESQNSLFFFKDENVHRNKRKTNHNINKRCRKSESPFKIRSSLLEMDEKWR
ncbi:uncharacterized protein LOC112904031 isoform X2 [Agrilus planipennis]|uniref:Uncharacterized protein LOC112904031 isoform X2 n=1 Tax=Agrilus planipennis TaxID=224129 RepID=A0A7F5R1Y4_AGRPL|nr:uncharacterized protein LOC112904031 isoform X2 [Agrilus planipennis]